MQNTQMFRVGLALVITVVLALFLVGNHNVVKANDDGCNAFTVKGTYGTAIGGLASATFAGDPQAVGDFFPLAAAGTFSFDGRGTASRALTVSFGGAIFPVTYSGPYTVNSDCTLSATYSDGTWNMVIIGRGKEIKAMNTAPGTAVQGVLTKQ